MVTVFYLMTQDSALRHRFEKIEGYNPLPLASLGQAQELPPGGVLVVDSAACSPPDRSLPDWSNVLRSMRVLYVSSAPEDAEGLAALDAGALGYCHAYSAPETLALAIQTLGVGQIWVGPQLMERLLSAVSRAMPKQMPGSDWAVSLTEREREVARRAAQGEGNAAIAEALAITERTVKAHLSAAFEKLSVADRLQLTLKVHGIK